MWSRYASGGSPRPPPQPPRRQQARPAHTQRRIPSASTPRVVPPNSCLTWDKPAAPHLLLGIRDRKLGRQPRRAYRLFVELAAFYLFVQLLPHFTQDVLAHLGTQRRGGGGGGGGWGRRGVRARSGGRPRRTARGPGFIAHFPDHWRTSPCRLSPPAAARGTTAPSPWSVPRTCPWAHHRRSLRRTSHLRCNS